MAYNGWKNYETWVVGMALDGNYTGEGDYHAVQELMRDTLEGIEGDENVRDAIWSLDDARKFRVADALKEYVAEYLLPAPEGLAGDLMGAALDEVDWEELAESKAREMIEEMASQ